MNYTSNKNQMNNKNLQKIVPRTNEPVPVTWERLVSPLLNDDVHIKCDVVGNSTVKQPRLHLLLNVHARESETRGSIAGRARAGWKLRAALRLCRSVRITLTSPEETGNERKRRCDRSETCAHEGKAGALLSRSQAARF